MKKFTKYGLYPTLIGLGLIKCWYTHQAMGHPFTITWALSSLSLLALLYLPLLLLNEQRPCYYAFAISALLSVLLYADIIYFRNFSIPLPIQTIGLAHQLGAVTQDIKDSTCWSDILLFADLPLLFWINKRFTAQKLNLSRSRKAWAANCLAIIALTTIGSSVQAMHHNQTMAISSFGALPYHISDLLLSQKKDHLYRTEFAELYQQKLEDYQQSGAAYKGIAAGRNLIIIQLESIQNLLLQRTFAGQEITPFLNQLLEKDTLYFDRFFQTAGTGRTADAEFTTLNSLYAVGGQVAYQEYADKDLYALPHILKKAGYEPWAFHGYEPDFWNRVNMYPNLGFTRFISQPDFEHDEVIGWGLGDRSFYRQSVDRLAEAPQPFFAFLVSLTSHNPYFMHQKHRTATFDISEYEESDSRMKRIFGYYFHAVHYADHALSELFQALKANDLYDNSLIVIYGDHFGLTKQHIVYNDEMSKFLGRSYGFDDMLNVPLLIHIPGLGDARTIHTVGGQVDLMPTILNLLGVEKEEGPIFAGQDLLNTSEGFVALPNFVPQGSFAAGSTFFLMSNNGLFQHSRAWNMDTGEPIPLEECWAGYNRALLEVQYSHWILEGNRVFAPNPDTP